MNWSDKFIYWYLHGDGVYWAIFFIIVAISYCF
jgi:hypothetical protein